jgi:HEAT repeat protein
MPLAERSPLALRGPFVAAIVLLAVTSCGGGEEPEFGNRAASEWAVQLSSSDPAVRAEARRELLEGKEEALPVLLRLSSHQDLYVTTELEAIFQGMGQRIVPALEKVLAKDSPSEAAAAAKALGSLGAQAGSAVPGLRSLLRSGKTEGRRAAAYAIGRVGREDVSKAVPDLLSALSRDGDSEVRMWAAKALGRVAVPSEEIVKGLVRGVGDRDLDVRLAAIRATERLGPKAGSAVSTLVVALGDKDLRVRFAAAKALGGIGAPAESAIPALEKDLANAPDNVVPPSAEALRRIRAAVARRKQEREMSEGSGK